MPITLNGTTGIVGPDGSAASPAIQGSDANTGIFFPAADTIAFAEGGAEVMRINSSGDVGIGTGSPATRLHVADSSTATVKLSNSTSGSGASDGLDLILSGADGYLYNRENGPLLFGTNNAERARIDSSGNFYINQSSTVTPGQSNVPGACFRGASSVYTLEVNGGANQAAIFGRSGDGQVMRFYNSTTFAGFINLSSNTTSYSSVSDYRLKEDIQPMIGALNVVMRQRPVTFKWKNSGEVARGFIAHWMQEDGAGECVSGIKDAVESYTDAEGNEGTRPAYQGVDTSFLVATLTAAIQEQQALIAALQADVAALKGQA